MKLSEQLWQQILPIYQEILSHPFNVELANGTLNQERFQFYLQQDAWFLMNFSKALALIAGRVNSSQIMAKFLNFALGALIAERELHKDFLTPHLIHDHIEPSPSSLAYTQYLIASAATASIEEAVAAVVPCYWIYREVGHYIASHSQEDNPYKQWIKTYSSPEFSEITNQGIAILNELSLLCPSKIPLMSKAFEHASLFEWLFWNDAYKMSLFQKAHVISFKEVMV